MTRLDRAVVPYRPSPLLMLQAKIEKEIAFHKAELARLQGRLPTTAAWELQDRIWDVLKPR